MSQAMHYKGKTLEEGQGFLTLSPYDTQSQDNLSPGMLTWHLHVRVTDELKTIELSKDTSVFTSNMRTTWVGSCAIEIWVYLRLCRVTPHQPTKCPERETVPSTALGM